MKKCLIIFSIIFVVLAVAFGISVAVTGVSDVNIAGHRLGWRVGFISGGDSIGLIDGREYSTGEVTTDTFDGVSFNDISVQLVNSDASIKVADVDKATVRYTAGSGAVRFGAEVRDGRLIISESPWFFFRIHLGSDKKSVLEVTLPNKEYGDLYFEAAAGTVNAEGITGRKLKVETASGSSEYRVFADSITMETASGSVKLINCTDRKADSIKISGASGVTAVSDFLTDTFSVELASGSARLAGISGKGSLNVASGKITLEYADWNDSLDIEAASGSIDVTLPEGSGAEINIEALSGTVSYDLDGESASLSGPRDICERAGGSNVHDIDVEILSGSVDIHN